MYTCYAPTEKDPNERVIRWSVPDRLGRSLLTGTPTRNHTDGGTCYVLLKSTSIAITDPCGNTFKFVAQAGDYLAWENK